MDEKTLRFFVTKFVLENVSPPFPRTMLILKFEKSSCQNRSIFSSFRNTPGVPISTLFGGTGGATFGEQKHPENRSVFSSINRRMVTLSKWFYDQQLDFVCPIFRKKSFFEN